MTDYDITVTVTTKKTYRMEGDSLADAQIKALELAISEYPDFDVWIDKERSP